MYTRTTTVRISKDHWVRLINSGKYYLRIGIPSRSHRTMPNVPSTSLLLLNINRSIQCERYWRLSYFSVSFNHWRSKRESLDSLIDFHVKQSFCLQIEPKNNIPNFWGGDLLVESTILIRDFLIFQMNYDSNSTNFR